MKRFKRTVLMTLLLCAGFISQQTKACNLQLSLNVQYLGGSEYTISSVLFGSVSPQYTWLVNDTIQSYFTGDNPSFTVTLTPGATSVVGLSVYDTATGCTVTDSVSIAAPDCAFFALLQSTPVNTGGLLLSVRLMYGGTPPYTYRWSDGTTDTTDIALYSGVYGVLITDSNGCLAFPKDSLFGLPPGPCTIKDSIGVQDLGGNTFIFTAYTQESNMFYEWSDDASYYYIQGAGDTLTLTLPEGLHYIAVFITDSSGVCHTADSIPFLVYPLAIRELENNIAVKVSPNPFHDYTTITVSGMELKNASLELYNIMGQRVAIVQPSDNGVFQVNRGGLGSGMYIYHIRQGTQSIGTGKLVID